MPLREIPSISIKPSDVEQMAEIIGGKVRFRDRDFLNVPYLVHPLGITIRFGERFMGYGTEDSTTRVSVAPVVPGASGYGLDTGDIVVKDGIVKIFEDAVVVRKHSQIMVNGEREDVVDQIRLTKEEFIHTREFVVPPSAPEVTNYAMDVAGDELQ
jgi:hypothetical protein